MNEEELHDRLRHHINRPYHRGTCPAATHRHIATISACGDQVQIELRVTQEDIVDSAYFSGHGCFISQAAASMLVEHIEGKSIGEIQSFSGVHMLQLFGLPLTPTRRGCCLLPWQVLHGALARPVDATPSKTEMIVDRE